jgi:hypothetical protein
MYCEVVAPSFFRKLGDFLFIYCNTFADVIISIGLCLRNVYICVRKPTIQAHMMDGKYEGVSKSFRTESLTK